MLILDWAASLHRPGVSWTSGEGRVAIVLPQTGVAGFLKRKW